MSSRFNKLLTDQRYKKGRIRIANKSKYLKKINLLDEEIFDERFSDIHTDKKFDSGKFLTVDKYGRKIDGQNKLSQFYGGEDDQKLETSEAAAQDQDQEHESETELDKEKFIDRARGNGYEEGTTSEEHSSESESESNTETPSNTVEKIYDDHVKSSKSWTKIIENFEQETSKYQPQIENSTKILAFVNLDWTKVTARDIFILCDSFLANMVEEVKIYKSEVGKLAEKKEAELREQQDQKSVAGSGEFESEPEYDREKLRAYELSKLRWRYAIVKTKSIEVAENIYVSCDNKEYMSSGILMNTSFVPEDMTFEETDQTDVWPKATKLSKAEENYEPLTLSHSSNSHTAIKSTFDEDDLRRRDKMYACFENKKEEDYFQDDLEMYGDLIASSESEEEGLQSEKDKKREMYKKMLLEIVQETKDKEEQNFHKCITIDLDENDSDNFSEDGHRKEESDEEMAENAGEAEDESGSEEDASGSGSDQEEEVDADEAANRAAQAAMLIGSDQESELESEDETEANASSTLPLKDYTEDDRFGSLYENKFSIDPSSKNYKKSDVMANITNKQIETRVEKRKVANLKNSQKKDLNSDEESDMLLAKLAKKAKK